MEEQEKVLEIDAEQLEEFMNVPENLPPIEIGLEDYDLEEFQRGIKETSHLAGVITALFNTGVSESFILDFLMNKDSIEHSIKVSNINKEMNIEVAKNAKLTQEKYEL
jgi:hypothetical protein